MISLELPALILSAFDFLEKDFEIGIAAHLPESVYFFLKGGLQDEGADGVPIDEHLLMVNIEIKRI